jgi:Protein of unknown function (DUF1647)
MRLNAAPQHRKKKPMLPQSLFVILSVVFTIVFMTISIIEFRVLVKTSLTKNDSSNLLVEPLGNSMPSLLTTQTYASSLRPRYLTKRKTAIIDVPPSVPGIIGQPCVYHGHCGVGTICNWISDSSDGATCQPLKQDFINSSFEESPCAQRCLTGLPSDAILMETSVSSKVSSKATNPPACALTFQRKDGHKREGFDTITYETALKNHLVVRMDPILSRPHHWIALCYDACATSDCGVPGFLCQNSVCLRDYKNDKDSTSVRLGTDMVIVSGADNSYFRSLTNLAGSIRYWAPTLKLVVYNLGMTEEQLRTIEKWGNLLELKWREGIPSHYPEHFKMLKGYAWKPVAINESVHEYKQIFWLDAGSTITGPITPAINITRNTGIFLVKGQDSDMKPKSHPGMFEAFGYNKDSFQAGPHYSGNTQAYLYPSRYIGTVVIPNAACALDERCIMPLGSDLTNHRYDQTSLSILAYQKDLKIPEYTQFLAAGRDQLSTDLKQPSSMFIWTSRGSCSEFLHLMEGYNQ